MRFKTLATIAVALVCAEAANAAVVSFSFDDGVLPSEHYVGSIPEADAFSIMDGVLHQNTLRFGIVHASYRPPVPFDPAVGGMLEWRARVVNSPLFGVEIGLYGSSHLFDFFLANSTVYYHNGSGIVQAFDLDTTAFHAYRLVIPPGGATFQLYVDDALSFSAAAPDFSGNNRVLWGDGTLSGGNGAAEWDYIRFTGGQVPEPTSIVLVGLTLVSAVLARAWRKRSRRFIPL